MGALVAGILLATQASAVGGINGLIQVGEVSPLRPIIEEQLGEVPLTHHTGHDGQIFYAMALDLSGDEVGDLFIDPAYRYRRIMYPAIASLFGLLDGTPLLIGMIVTVVLSMAFATGSIAAIGRLMGKSEFLALAVILNPGVWLAIRLLTSEVLATGLMCLGLLAFVLRNKSMHVAFSMSALSKETFLLTPLGLGVSRRWRRWLVGVIPTAVLILWSIWGQMSLGGLEGESNNLSLPLTGIFQATEIWPLGGFSDWFYVILALVLVVAATVLAVAKRGWLRWSLLGWAALAVCSSWYVWRIGNNAARVYAPMLILVVLHLFAPPDFARSEAAKAKPNTISRQPDATRS